MRRYVTIESISDGTDVELGRYKMGYYGWLLIRTAEGELAFVACEFSGPSLSKIHRTQTIREDRVEEFRDFVSRAVDAHRGM